MDIFPLKQPVQKPMHGKAQHIPYYRRYTVNVMAKYCAILLVNLEFFLLFAQLDPLRMCMPSLLQF